MAQDTVAPKGQNSDIHSDLRKRPIVTSKSGTRLKITIITVVFNAHTTIDDCMKSVEGQEYPNVEHIVIDGGSTDGTQDHVRRHAQRLAHFISERDKGIYDAMNKGLQLATGDVVGFLNADDIYTSPLVLNKVGAIFNNPDVEACYGNLCYVKKNNISAVVRYWKSSAFRPNSFPRGWCPPHPTFFARRAVYERLGGFDLSYTLAADVDLMMRFLEVHRIRTTHIPEVLIKMRMGGASNRSIRNIVRLNREILRALKKNGLPSSFFMLIGNKLLSRGRQFLTRPPSASTTQINGA